MKTKLLLAFLLLCSIALLAAATVRTFTQPVVINPGNIGENDSSLTVLGSTNVLADILNIAGANGSAQGSISVTNTNGATQKMQLILGNGAQFAISEMPVYATNAAAAAGGLRIGSFYRTGGDPDVVAIVH